MMAIAMLNKSLEVLVGILKKKNYFTKWKTRQAFQTNSMRPVLLIRNHKHTKNIQEEKKNYKAIFIHHKHKKLLPKYSPIESSNK